MKGIIGSQMKDKPQVNAQVLARALTGVRGMLYKDGLIEKIADMIGAGKDAAAVVSDVVSMMVGEVQKKYADIDSQTILVFAVYSIAEIVKTLRDGGMVKDGKTVTEDAIKGVVMKYVAENPDSIDPSAMQSAQPTDDDIKNGQRLMTGVAV